MLWHQDGQGRDALQVTLWTGCATAFGVAGLSAWADWRRARRTNIDAVGFMPWPLIMILSILIGAVLAAIALHRK
ncbi:MAG: hypothetical protein EBS21_04185 [Sphingomonadaceae bacterium]|nr:hypothetical protein [Sphingomonadaceae bacterium]